MEVLTWGPGRGNPTLKRQGHGSEFTDTDLKLIGIYYIVFILVDLLAAVVGAAWGWWGHNPDADAPANRKKKGEMKTPPAIAGEDAP